MLLQKPNIIVDSKCSEILFEAMAYTSKINLQQQKSNGNDYLDTAINILNKLITTKSKITYDIIMDFFTIALHSKSPTFASTAEQYFRLILQNMSELQFKPKIAHFNKLLDLYSKVSFFGSGYNQDSSISVYRNKIQDVLSLMKQYNIKEDIVTMNTIMNIYLNSPIYELNINNNNNNNQNNNNNNNQNEIRSMSMMEELIFSIYETIKQQQLVPDLITYTSLLMGISRSNDIGAPLRADKIFQNMLLQSTTASSPINQTSSSSLSSTTTTITTTTNQKNSHKNTITNTIIIKPDSNIYSVLISIWCKSYRDDKETRVMEIYENMKLYKIKPTVVTFTSILTMWSSSRHQKARTAIIKVFRHMKSLNLSLDLIGYSSLLTGISKSKDINAAIRADDIFTQMTNTQGIQPDAAAFNILLNIWTKTQDPHTITHSHSTSTPSPIESAGSSSSTNNNNGGSTSVSTITASTATSTSTYYWKKNHKEKRINTIFNTMVASGVKPTIYTYTILLNFWSNCKYPQAKTRILELYNRLITQDYIRWDDRAFESLLYALKKISITNTNTNTNIRDTNTQTQQGISSSIDSEDYLMKAENLLYTCVEAGWIPSIQVWIRLLTTDLQYPQSYIRMLRIYNYLTKANIPMSIEFLIALLKVLYIACEDENNALIIAYAVTNKIIDMIRKKSFSSSTTIANVKYNYELILDRSCLSEEEKMKYKIIF